MTRNYDTISLRYSTPSSPSAVFILPTPYSSSNLTFSTKLQPNSHFQTTTGIHWYKLISRVLLPPTSVCLHLHHIIIFQKLSFANRHRWLLYPLHYHMTSSSSRHDILSWSQKKQVSTLWSATTIIHCYKLRSLVLRRLSLLPRRLLHPHFATMLLWYSINHLINRFSTLTLQRHFLHTTSTSYSPSLDRYFYYLQMQALISTSSTWLRHFLLLSFLSNMSKATSHSTTNFVVYQYKPQSKSYFCKSAFHIITFSAQTLPLSKRKQAFI